MGREFSGNGRLPFGECNLHDWRRDETKKVVGSHPLQVPWTTSGPPARHVVAATRCRHSHSTWWIRKLAAWQQQQTTPTVLVDDTPTVPSPLLPPAPPLLPPSPPRRAVLPVGCNHGAVGQPGRTLEAARDRIVPPFRQKEERK